MAKKRKSKSEKEVARLRREVEVLRAQLAKEEKTEPSPVRVEKNIEEPKEVKVATLKSHVSYDYVRQGLKKTATLTVFATAILIGLYFSQPYWPSVTSLIH